MNLNGFNLISVVSAVLYFLILVFVLVKTKIMVKSAGKIIISFKKRRMDQQIHTPNLYIVIIPYEFFQLHFPDSSFQTDTLVSHTQSQPKLES